MRLVLLPELEYRNRGFWVRGSAFGVRQALAGKNDYRTGSCNRSTIWLTTLAQSPCLRLSEQPHAWVPSRMFALKKPTPVRYQAQQNPDFAIQGTGEMGYRGIAGDHQIQVLQDGRCIHEGTARLIDVFRKGMNRIPPSPLCQLFFSEPELQAKELDVRQFAKWMIGRQREGSEGICLVVAVPLPCQPNTTTFRRNCRNQSRQ